MSQQNKDEEPIEIMSDSDNSFDFEGRAGVFRATKNRREVSGSFVQRGKKNIQEQKMA